ncbi:MAG: S8 family serine peptidase, partial [Planctomycetota bacterium]
AQSGIIETVGKLGVGTMRRCDTGLTFELLESRELLAADGLGVGDLIQTAMARWAWSADRAGSTRATAAELGRLDDPVTLPGRLSRFDRSDVFEFQLTEAADVDLELARQFGNSDLALYDAAGQLISRSADGFSRELISETLGAGTYYVEASAGGAWISRYALSLSAEPLVASPPPASEPAPAPTPDPKPIDAPPVSVPPADTPPPIDDGAFPPIEPLPEVPYFGGVNEWNLNTIQAPEAWAAGTTGEGITVAVVDTGVDFRHVDLASNIWTNTNEIAGDGIDNDGNGFVDDVRGWNFADNNAQVSDTQGHGTHVAGTIAAAANGRGATGVAPDATIMPVRVLGDDGAGSSSDVAAGIRYAVENGAHIINLSLGGGFSFAVQSALNYALANDVLVVAAAGNESAAHASYPAAHSANFTNVISVGAHDRQGNRASFSNLPGSGVVQVDAPGVGIYSTLVGGGFGTMSGTSMAAPHVAGLAALALSSQPTLTASELRIRLVEGATRTVGRTVTAGVDAAATLATRAMAEPIAALTLVEFDDQADYAEQMLSLLVPEPSVRQPFALLAKPAQVTRSSDARVQNTPHEEPSPTDVDARFATSAWGLS